MLDKNDLQAIAELMLQQKEELVDLIKEEARAATSRAIAYSENTVERKLDVIKEGLDLALERPRVSEDRVEALETDVSAIKFTVRKHAQELEELKKAK